MNVHILSHLNECVRNWGPIWCYTCFAFETRNSDIKRLFHGSRDMSKQVNTILRSHGTYIGMCPIIDGIFIHLDASYPKRMYE